MFKLILMQSFPNEIQEKNQIEKRVLTKILNEIEKTDDKEFIKNCIFLKLEEANSIESFFKSLFIIKLDQIRYQEFLKSDIEKINSKNKKKKKKLLKNSNKKQFFSSLQDNISFKGEEISETVNSLPTNKINIQKEKEYEEVLKKNTVSEKNEIIKESKKDGIKDTRSENMKVESQSILSFYQKKTNKNVEWKSQRTFKKNTSYKISSGNDTKNSINDQKTNKTEEDKNFFVLRRNSDIIGKKKDDSNFSFQNNFKENPGSIKSENCFTEELNEDNVVKSTSNNGNNGNKKNDKKTNMSEISKISGKKGEKKNKSEKKLIIEKTIEKKFREPTPKKLLEEYFVEQEKTIQQRSLHNQNVISFQQYRRTNSAFKKKNGSNYTVQIKTDDNFMNISSTNKRDTFTIQTSQRNNMNIPFNLKQIEKNNLENDEENSEINEEDNKNKLRNKSSEQKRNKFKNETFQKEKLKIKKFTKIKKTVVLSKWSDSEKNIQTNDDKKIVQENINNLSTKKNQEDIISNNNEDFYTLVKKEMTSLDDIDNNMNLQILKEIQIEKKNSLEYCENKTNSLIDLSNNNNSNTNPFPTKNMINFFTSNKNTILKKKEEKNKNKFTKVKTQKEKFPSWKDDQKLFSNNSKKLEFLNNNEKSNQKDAKRKLTLTVNSPNNSNTRRNTMNEKEINKKFCTSPLNGNINVNRRLFISERKYSEEEQNNLKVIINKIYIEKLNDQFNEFIQRIQDHTDELKKPREIVLNILNDILKETFQNQDIYFQTYGSYSTNLLTPFSDVDLSIQNCKYFCRKKVLEMLAKLEESLKKFEFVKKVTAIFNALVPVLKIEIDPSIQYKEYETIQTSYNLKIDIVVDLVEDHNNNTTSSRTTEYIKLCIKEYPSFFKNILFLKYVLAKKNLSNTYKGGLNSYGLGIIYVAYLIEKNKIKEIPPFGCLINFLTFLSHQFDPNIHAVYLNNNSPHKFVIKNVFEYSYLVVIDPTSFVWKNITPNGVLFPKIIEYFKNILSQFFSTQKKIFDDFVYFQGAIEEKTIQQKIDKFFEDNKLTDLLYDIFEIGKDSFLIKDHQSN